MVSEMMAVMSGSRVWNLDHVLHRGLQVLHGGLDIHFAKEKKCGEEKENFEERRRRNKREKEDVRRQRGRSGGEGAEGWEIEKKEVVSLRFFSFFLGMFCWQQTSMFVDDNQSHDLGQARDCNHVILITLTITITA